jgi:adenylylsulfate reductase subunit A
VYYPGFYYRQDFPTCDDENWKCFVNSTFNPDTQEWKCEKVECINVVETDPWL